MDANIFIVGVVQGHPGRGVGEGPLLLARVETTANVKSLRDGGELITKTWRKRSRSACLMAIEVGEERVAEKWIKYAV
eukprot:11224355-Lingulodinium_polyedra.AAC.1